MKPTAPDHRASRVCPECGRPLPDNAPKGLCPLCLVALASEPLTEGKAPDAEPHRVLGDFELLNEIASGGMGVVFRARQLSLNRLVALKTIRSGQLAGAGEVQRFRTEAEAAANLDHPNIVPIYEVGEERGQHFFSMKLIEGESLAKQIGSGRWRVAADNKSECQRAIAGLLVKVARAVHHAHERGVLHRDLKPSNILLDDQGEPHLTDFGLAKLVQHDTDLTRTFAVVGTVGYMSPEQAAGKSKQITMSADIYSLGAVLYELLTGRMPFGGDDPMAVLRAVVENEPRRPRELNPCVNAEVETICLKCLEKTPSQRYATALELASDLERWLRDEPILARPSSAWERATKWVKRRPLRAALVGVIALAVTVTSLLFAYARRQSWLTQLAQIEVTNRVGQMEVQKAQDFFETQNPAAALAHLAQVLRENPANSAAAARLMAALSQRPFALLLGEFRHAGAIHSVAFSPDGSRIVTASDDRTARLWETATGRPLRSLERHQSPVLCAAFSLDGSRLVTGSKDRVAMLWDASTGDLRSEFPHAWWVRAVHLSPDSRYLLSVTTNTVLIRDLQSGTVCTQRVTGPYVRCAAFSGNGQRVVAGGHDGETYIWQVASGQLVAKPGKQQRAVLAAQFSPDGQRVATGSDDGTARVWSADTGQPITGPMRHGAAVVSVRFHPSGALLVTASVDGTAGVWDARSGGLVCEPLKHKGQVRAACFSPDGDSVLTASDDGTVRLWDAATGLPRGEAIRHPDFVEDASFAPDGRLIVTLCADHVARLWRVPAAQPLFRPQDLAGATTRFELSADGLSAVVVSNESVAVWSLLTGRPLATLRQERGVEFAKLSSQGQYVAAVCRDRTVRIWSPGRADTRALKYDGPVSGIEFSADGHKLLTVSGGIVGVWEIGSGAQVAGPWVHDRLVQSAHFSADGRWVVTASGNQARLFEVRLGSRAAGMFQQKVPLESVELSRDSRLLLAVGRDHTIRVWDTTTRKPVPLPSGIAGRTAHLGPDGRSLVTISGTSAWIWNLANGCLLAEMHHAKEVNSAGSSPDGLRLATSAADQTLRVWDASTGQALTDPIGTDTGVWGARFTACGRWVQAQTDEGVVMWELPATSLPVPSWLAELAEAMAGQRLGEGQILHPATCERLLQLRTELAFGSETNSYAAWARWFFADPTTRPVSPSARITMDQYLGRLARTNTTSESR